MSSAPWRNTAHSPDVPHQSSGAAVTVRKEFMVPGERSTKVLQSRIKIFEGWYFVFLFLSMGTAEMKDVNLVPRDQEPTKTPSPPRKHTWVCRGKLIITFCFRDAFFSVPSTFCSKKVKKTNSGKGKRKEYTGFASPWTFTIVCFFEHEVFGEHFMVNVIHHELIHVIHPGTSREADQPRVFKCLSLVAPLGQTELRAHSSSTMERVWAISPEFALKDQTAHK